MNRSKFLKFFLIFSFISIMVLGIVTYIVWKDYQKFISSPINQQYNSNLSSYLFEIKRGNGLKSIVNKLRSQGIITQPMYFMAYIRWNKLSNKLKAGEYEISKKMTPKELASLFISGKVKQYSITFPEGWQLKQITKHLSVQKSLQAHNKNASNFYKLLGIRHENPEGMFFPDTYFYTKGTSASEILKRSHQKMQNILLKEWQNKEAGLPLKTPYEALILASIVEKESGISSERDKVAGVFIRRLKKKMRLQSDPTIIYGMGERYKGNIRKKDIKEKTAYNTYQINALPPTPIASPSKEAIHAVLHPDKGKSLYFVADGKGGHVFSNTLIGHNKAVRAYLKKLRSR